jgi:uncharacterized RDD family membrane protein YckC
MSGRVGPVTGAPAYAGVIIRLAALVLDLCCLSLLFFLVTKGVKGTWVMSATDHRWANGWFVSDPLCMAFLGAMFLYFVLFEGLAAATPGKMALGLRVVASGGGRAGLSRSFVRNVLRLVDGLPALGIAGAVMIASSPEGARFGDRAAGTRVVRVR